ncbi:hypothetical protein [Leptolyngbya sp. FACHB-16]|uniref:hypothetical protein n=1 Tax=unclassified Leptolyngbya TaxID=2650499 RepID=UPI001686F6A6|nr:hypothetical protein [Leptolyngbya sp. FACHB-16]MBD2153079.1 hypothetical protein [Leptolyngbya sp. FACHB-16]
MIAQRQNGRRGDRINETYALNIVNLYRPPVTTLFSPHYQEASQHPAHAGDVPGDNAISPLTTKKLNGSSGHGIPSNFECEELLGKLNRE